MTARKTIFAAICALFLCSNNLPALAQNGPVSIEYSLLRTSQPPAEKLLENSAWSKQVASGRFEVLNRGTVLARWGEDAYAMMGRKVPVTYFDPRAGSAQVQYTDVGFKIDCKPVQLPGGLIQMDIRMDQMHSAGTEQPIDEVEGLVCESTFLIKRGQTVVLATVSGALTARYLGTSFPSVKMGEDTTVLFAISVK